MKKTLLLLRHAKSSWKDKGLKDFDRPLKEKGEVAAKLIGKMLYHSAIVPDVVLSSPAKRARETAEIVTKHGKFPGKIQYLDDLYMGEPRDYIRALREMPEEVGSVMLVGHNPGMEIFLQMLEGNINDLSTSTLAMLELDLTNWSNINSSTTGKLIHFWDPDEMDLEEIKENMAKDKKEKGKKDKKKEK